MTQVHKLPFHSGVRMAYVMALFIIGTLGTLITPALLESWSGLRWTQAQLGTVAGIELAGLGIGSLSGLYWQRRWPWHPVTIVSLAAAALANWVCIGLTSYFLVCLARATAGIAGGTLTAVYSAYMANLRAPVRLVATTTFIQIALEALFIFGAPTLFSLLGPTGIFTLMALLLLALMPLWRAVPSRWPDAATVAKEDIAPVHGSWRGYPLLLAFLPYTLVQAGVYTFLGKFAQLAAHMTVDSSLRTVGISVILSSLGAILAYAMDEHRALRLPIVAALVVMGLGLSGITWWAHSGMQFLVACAGLQIAWILLNCLLYAALVHANNLLVPAASTVSCVGSALGAWMVGGALDAYGTVGAFTLAITAIAATGALSIPFLRSTH